MRHNNPEEFLAADVGGTRVGIARGSSLARIAQPLKTVPAAEAINELAALATKNQASGIVIGLPRSLEGKDTGQTETVRQWVKVAQAKIELPFYWQDEALTTVKAESLKLKAKSQDVDSVAAAIILQDFLDTPVEDRIEV